MFDVFIEVVDESENRELRFEEFITRFNDIRVRDQKTEDKIAKQVFS